MKVLKSLNRKAWGKCWLAAGLALMAGTTASAQNLFVSEIRFDWDPGASTLIDEETQIVSFRPGDPITYSVTYGRSNGSNPPQGPQPFIVKVFLSPDGNGEIGEGDPYRPVNLDNFELDRFSSYGAGTFNGYADAEGLPIFLPADDGGDSDDRHPVRLEEAGMSQQTVPSFTRTRTRTVMLPRNYTGTFFLTAVIRKTDGPSDGPNALTRQATLTTARINIVPEDSPTVARISNGSGSDGDANAMSEAPSVSEDGRYVVYHSEATDIVSGFSYPSGVAQVYLRDNLTDTTTLLSQRGGQPGNQPSLYPVIAADGAFVAYQSEATNLVTNDTNQQTDIFVYQLATGVTTRISVPNTDVSPLVPGGNIQANGGSFLPSISRDGRTIAFESDAANLVASRSDPDALWDTNGVRDVYVFRQVGDSSGPGAIVRGLIVPASIRWDGISGDGASSQAAVSQDGNSVAFRSFAENLPTNPAVHERHDGKLYRPVTRRTVDNRRLSEIYVKDLGYVNDLIDGSSLSDGYGFVLRASLKPTTDYAIGVELDRDAYDPAISDDGRYVAFASRASNVQPHADFDNTENVSQVYVLNRQVDASEPRDIEGNMALTLISQAEDGDFADEDAMEPVISGNGRFVGYRTGADNLQPLTVTRSDGVVFNTYYESEWSAPEDWAALDANRRFDLYSRATLGEQNIRYFAETNGTSDIYIRDTGIAAIEVDDGGSGYSNASPPKVTITGGGGFGAEAVAIVEDGRVARIDVTVPGYGYTIPYDVPQSLPSAGTHPLYDDRLQVEIEGNATATGFLAVANERATVNKFGMQVDSVAIGSHPVTGTSRNLSLSADGRYLVFASDATWVGSFIYGKSNWHPLDNNQNRDVFMIDRRVGEVLSPDQGILPIIAVTMDSHPATFGSNRLIRVTAFDGASNPVGLDGKVQDTRGRITNLRIFANEVEFPSIVTTDLDTERATARTTWTVPSIEGAYQIYAVAEDIDGNIVVSDPVNIPVSPPFSLEPQVNVTVTPTMITLGDTVTIRAFPSDPDNGVSFVRYFSNGTQIGLTVTPETHQISYTPSEVDDYEIVAVVADGPPPENDPPEPALRNTRMSSTQVLRVSPLPSPEVTIIRPTGTVNAAVGEPVFFEFQALTSNPSASISAVNLVVRSGDQTRRIAAARIGLTSNYRVEWRPLAEFAGSVTLHAEAVDSQNTVGRSDELTGTVFPASANPPLVEIVNPGANESGMTNETIPVRVLVAGATIDRVDLYANGSYVGRATFNSNSGYYEESLDLSLLGTGEFDLIAVARGPGFIVRASERVSFSITTPRPQVAIVSPGLYPDPEDGELLTQVGQPVLLSIHARSPDPLLTIENVSVIVDDVTVGVAARIPNTNSYTLTWTPDATGLSSISASATDSAGGTVITPSITVRVIEADGAPAPVVTMVSPEDGFAMSRRSEWIFVATAVSDESEIATVEFFLGSPGDPGLGIQMGNATGTADEDWFQLRFDLDKLPPHFSPMAHLLPGVYQVTAVARDLTGNVGQSAPVTISVLPVEPPRPRLENFRVNKTETTLTESVRVEVEVANPVPPMQGVALYGNGDLLAPMEMVTGGGLQPGKFWIWEGILPTPGTWNLYAIGTDLNGSYTASDSVNVTVGRALFRLDLSENVYAGQPASLEVELLAGNPAIGWVEFYVDGAFLTSTSTAPYVVEWVPAAVGEYEITAQVWDQVFNEYYPVAPVTVRVVPAPVPPEFTWERETIGSADLFGIAAGSGGFVAVGQGGAVRASADGSGWSAGSVGSETFRAIASDGDQFFVAVGDPKSADPKHARIAISENGGDDWNGERPESGTPRRLAGVVRGKAASQDLFVAVGNAGVIRVSRNVPAAGKEIGFDWENRPSGVMDNLHAVAYRPDADAGEISFVAVGASGVVLTSINGENWVRRTSETTADLYDVAYADGRFVAVGGRWAVGTDSARILTSTDGIDWSVGGSDIPSILRGVAFGGGSWLAVGTGGGIAASPNGLDWVQPAQDPFLGSPTRPILFGVAYHNDRFVAVGEDGAVLRSEPGNYATWASIRYTAEECLDPNIGGMDADPDGTGLPNLLRYALGINGADSMDRCPRVMVLSNPSQPYLALEYVRPKGRQDVSYIVEASSNLIDWTPIESGGGSIDVTANGNLETVVARDGVNIDEVGGRRFLRLRVEVIE